LKKLEIKVLTEPIVYVLGNEAASVTQEHSVNTWYKTGQEFKDIKQMMTFIWHKRKGKWKIVHSSFTTKG
jgi:ketosteroid isomerase-like protein